MAYLASACRIGIALVHWGRLDAGDLHAPANRIASQDLPMFHADLGPGDAGIGLMAPAHRGAGQQEVNEAGGAFLRR